MRIFQDDEERRKAIITTPRLIKKDLIDNNALLFSKAARMGYDMIDFMERFMRSKTAVDMDMELTHYQWEGPESLLSDFIYECCMDNIELKDSKYTKRSAWEHDANVCYWIGYIYRLTHFKTGESSKEIVDFMPAEMMTRAYYTGHCEDPDNWIENYTFKKDLEKYGKYYLIPGKIDCTESEDEPGKEEISRE